MNTCVLESQVTAIVFRNKDFRVSINPWVTVSEYMTMTTAIVKTTEMYSSEFRRSYKNYDQADRI